MDTTDYAEYVAKSTGDLRTNGDPSWVRHRDCLREQGVDPERAVLAQIWQEDVGLESGVVVAPVREVYEFELDWLHHPEGAITKLTRITDDRCQWPGCSPRLWP